MTLRRTFSMLAAVAAVTIAAAGAAQAQNCMEVLDRTPEASRFVAALTRTGQTALLRSSVVAEAARFNAHIVDGKVASTDLQGQSSASFHTRNGNELKLVRGQDGRFVLMPQGRGRRAVEGRVVRADIPCSNGVIHLVDTVLIKY